MDTTPICSLFLVDQLAGDLEAMGEHITGHSKTDIILEGITGDCDFAKFPAMKDFTFLLDDPNTTSHATSINPHVHAEGPCLPFRVAVKCLSAAKQGIFVGTVKGKATK